MNFRADDEEASCRTYKKGPWLLVGMVWWIFELSYFVSLSREVEGRGRRHPIVEGSSLHRSEYLWGKCALHVAKRLLAHAYPRLKCIQFEKCTSMKTDNNTPFNDFPLFINCGAKCSNGSATPGISTVQRAYLNILESSRTSKYSRSHAA